MTDAPLFKAIDLGVGMAAALAAQMMGHVGAQVTRIEPDAGDPFYEVYPAYAAWRRGEARAGRADLEALLAGADVVLLGGEDYPGLEWSFDADALSRRFPKLVVVEIAGYATADAAARPSVDLLVQARTGLVNEEYSARPMAYAFPMPSYGAALLAVLGAEAALVERRRSGLGQVVRTSLQQGAGVWPPGIWASAERVDAAFKVGTPKDVKQPIFRCQDGKYLIFMVGTPGVLKGVYGALDLDIEVDPNDRALPDITRGPVNYFIDRALVEAPFAQRDREQLLDKLWKAGVAADAVLPPGAIWDHQQTTENRLIEPLPDGGRAVASPLRLQAFPAPGAAAATPRDSDAKGPLAGLRIIDLGAFVAGPYASKLLADLGAETIKVEPTGGDPFRYMYRNFASVSRGKHSFAVDMKAPEGLALVQQLCAGADAVTHNMRVGVAERLGFGAETLRTLNPDVVTVHSSAYGPSGPKALNSGWDPVLQPYCGHSIRAGGEGNDPLCYQIPILDYGAGILSAVGVLAGVLRRDQVGGSLDVHTSLLATGVYMLSELVQRANGAFEGAPPVDRDQTGFHAAERLYQAADGWIAVAARSDQMAEAFAAAFGLTLGPRDGWGDAEAGQLAAAIRPLRVEEALAKLEAAGVWAERCAADGWAEFLANPAAREIGFVAERQDAHYGRITAVGQLMTFSRSPLETALRDFPKVGEDTRRLALETGLDGAQIDALYAKGVIA